MVIVCRSSLEVDIFLGISIDFKEIECGLEILHIEGTFGKIILKCLESLAIFVHYIM